MSRWPVVLLAWVVCAGAAAQAARDGGFPRVLHGDAALHAHDADGLAGRIVEVDGALAQIRLDAAIVLTAGRGARLAMLRPDGRGDDWVLVVADGPVLVVDTEGNRVRALDVGSHLLRRPATADSQDWIIPLAAPGRPEAAALAGRGMNLGDWVMVRQQRYLDSLSIDIAPINRAVASLIRRLIPGRAR